MRRLPQTCALLLLLTGCEQGQPPEGGAASDLQTDIQKRMAKYTTIRLTTDLSALTENEQKMVPLLIEAAKIMDDLFWEQAYGHKESLLESLDPDARRFAEINYGPWDRLEGNQPFLRVEAKPAGANLYPSEMDKAEFERAIGESPGMEAGLKSLYTLVRRDHEGKLAAIPYSTAFAGQLGAAAEKLRQAAGLAEDAGLRKYLEMRADALVSDDYQPSDLAWLDMKDNTIDVVIGPIETYEDQLYGYKAAFEAYVLVKDKEWSRRLARYASMLPALQAGLPVPKEYKAEKPGGSSDLNAYDAVYYAGDGNAGSKTIAINLPNDEEVQLQKGTRRLQLKNVVRAKFEKILEPIADELIAEDQRQHVTFDAFFANTMFHEVAHGLGIKNTIGDKGTVREALKEQASALEEGKADVLGLYMISSLHQKGDLEGDLRDNYVTFMASVFRSIRFGASSAHGLANTARFNFFEKAGAFGRDPATGEYRVNFDKMEEAMNALSEKILRFQGDGDYEGVASFMKEMAVIGPTLQGDLGRLATRGIPVDVVFEQGISVLNQGI